MLNLNLSATVLAVSLLAATSAQAGPPAPISQAGTAAGPILVDAAGMSLYVFAKDAPGKSNCNDACARNWPPLLAGAGAKPKGDYGLITRDDGAAQWSVKSKPLYRWIKDQKPGDTTGEGLLDGAWRLAKPAR